MSLLETLKKSLTKKKTVRFGGVIEDHFDFMGESYIHTREDPDSNKKAMVNTKRREITDPCENLLVDLAYEQSYREYI